MMKITPSILVESFSGSLGGSTLKPLRGRTLIKTKTIPRRPRTEHQQLRKGFLSRLSAEYFSLSETSKLLWAKFGSLQNPSMSGQNAYCMLNMNLLSAQTDSLSIVTEPPLTPGTPESPSGLTVENIDPAVNLISWDSPIDTDIFMHVFYATQSGFSHKGKESWHHLITVPSFNNHVHHGFSFPTHFLICYRAHTLDRDGRKSPWTPTIGLSTPAFTRGKIIISDVTPTGHAESVRAAFVIGYGDASILDDIEIRADGSAADRAYALSIGAYMFVRSTTGMSGYIPWAEEDYPILHWHMPTGGNTHVKIYDCAGTPPVIVTAGAGDVQNETAWDIEFFDHDPFSVEPSDTSSISNPVIAGKLLKIIDTLQCSYWEGRYRARMTASRGGIWTAEEGYGIINVNAAIAYTGSIPEDPYLN